MRTPLVRHGEDARLYHGDHHRVSVYSEMLLQVVRDYSGLPNCRDLSDSEIRWFYDGLRAELKQATKPR